ncbi:helix-turn-helix domain-containing protein [Gaoshiqia sp. Z1-71]|uniref:helix-turn-helix domain-containing protein n=1 Tax=Gaoshiqia hydrogeniformans TaxID=3290090 RepID=UPI003BF91CDF
MTATKNELLDLAFHFVRDTNQNIFLTGKAGTGKTTFLKNLKRESPKRMMVVAPTGVAAINAGGVTIHSFFQMSFGPQVPQENPSLTISNPEGLNAPTAIKRYSKEKINIIRSLDLLVIDEISMVRADLLDGIDEVLRRFRDKRKPFGGVQLLMIGDLQQLAPVVKDDEWEILRKYYDTCYFFSSLALRKSCYVSIELKHIYRQSDENFIRLLNKIRENELDEETLAELNKRYLPGFHPNDQEGYITLTTHNYQAQEINQSKLNGLKTKAHTFQARIRGEFPEYMYPTEPELALKAGAQVMFVKNDSSVSKRYYNGKIGTLHSITDDGLKVQCPNETELIWVEPEEWQNAKYALNPETQEIEETVAGTFEQYPLKLAWAITIHKSQGLTFEKAIINARQSFAHGQVYVALSRCKSLEGLVLSAPIMPQSVKNDHTVSHFISEVEQNQPDDQDLLKAKQLYQQQLLTELFDFNPVQRHIQYVLKLCNEHGSLLLGNLNQQLQSILPTLKTELIEVAGKFQRQLISLSGLAAEAEQNEALQERVKKACPYFLKTMDTVILQALKTANFETDNQAIRKSLQEGLQRLRHELKVKQASLESCLDGFELKRYLDSRAKAAIEPEGSRAADGTGHAAISKYPDFFKQMLAWRHQKAKESRVEIARVMRQKTLLELVEKLPATIAQLKAVKGMGGKKMQQFGKEILKMTIEYRRRKGLELPLKADNEISGAGLDSKETSLHLFQQGLTVAEIAQKRQMAQSTIEGHLAHFVGLGELDINRLVDPQKRKVIAELAVRKPGSSLGELKAALGSSYSYAEIRYVIKHHEAERTKKINKI